MKRCELSGWLSVALCGVACAPPSSGVDSGRPEDAGLDAGVDAGIDAGQPDAGPGCDAGLSSGTLSGSRIKIKWLQTDEGDRFFSEWFDSQLGVRCILGGTPDDGERCVPFPAAQVIYTAAGCMPGSELAVASKRCGASEAWATLPTYDCPFGMNHVFPVTGSAPPPAQEFMVVSDGRCVGPFPVDTTMTYYAVGPEADPTTFVAVTPVTVHAGERFELRGKLGDDGSLFPNGLYDTQRMQECAVVLAADGTMRCLSLGAKGSMAGTFFSDSQCQQALVWTPPGTCGYGTQPAFAWQPGHSEACTPEPVKIFSVGDPVANPALFMASGGTCHGPVTTSPAQFNALGPETPADQFGPGALGWTSSCRQVAEETKSAGGVTFSNTNSFHSNVENVGCSWDQGTDGKQHCFPGDSEAPDHHSAMATVLTFYLDGACTQPVDLAYLADSCNVLPAPKWGGKRSSACPPVMTVYEIGEPVTATVYEMIGNSCTGELTPTANKQLFQIGAEVPPSTFGSADLVVDP